MAGRLKAMNSEDGSAGAALRFPTDLLLSDSPKRQRSPAPVNITFGKKSVQDHHAASNLLNPRTTLLELEEIESKEKIYKRSPLGKSAAKHPAPPPEVAERGFGVSTVGGLASTFELLDHPISPREEEGEGSPNRRRKPGAGEPLRRGYDWDINIDRHTFGKASSMEGDHMGQIMSWKNETKEEIAARKRGQELRDQLASRTFGVKCEKTDDARDIMLNWGEEARKNDETVGKSRTKIENMKNKEKEVPSSPSSPNSISLPALNARSLTSPIKETLIKPNAKDVSVGSSLSVNTIRDEWIAPRTKEELFDIVRCAIGISQEDFSEVFSLLERGDRVVNVENFHIANVEYQMKKKR